MSRTRNKLFICNTLALTLAVFGQSCSDDSKNPNETTETSSTDSMTGSSTDGDTGNTTNSGSSSGTTTSSSTPSNGNTGTTSSTDSNSGSSTGSNSGTSTGSTGTGTGDNAMDPYLWLEEAESTRAQEWVKARNDESKAKIEAVLGFNATKNKLKAMMDSDKKIPYITQIGANVYNFWQDANHVRGIWRRTTLADYRTGTPNWTTVLDLDALAMTDSKSWVWKGANCIKPAGDRCLISLSDGGKDAAYIKEFDTTTNSFVNTNPFNLEEGNSLINWIDKDNVYVATDFGGMDDMSNSGYPRIVKRWKRGDALSAATELKTVPKDHLLVVGERETSGGTTRDFIVDYINFYERDYLLLDTMSNKWNRIDVPKTADIGFWGPWMYVVLKDDWDLGAVKWKRGSVVIINEQNFKDGNRNFQALYEPSRGRAFSFIRTTQNHILVGEMENVKGRLFEWSFDNNNTWQKREVLIPENGSFSVSALDAEANDDYLMLYSNFLTPSTYYLCEAGLDKREVLGSLPEFFDTNNLEVQQFFAVSKDGTSVPYFQISRKDLVQNSENPTLLYGYGGFEISLKPQYYATHGVAWLNNGGVLVIANIRGGGEYGPAWHQAALKSKRQNAYDDFIAVAEHLNARKIAKSEKLGIVGGSNGGLLTGVMLTQRPELFGAVVSQVPLLDMKRYTKLPPGALWIGEYGDPELPEDWAYISKYSPYQNLKADADYPPTLFTTSTKDDRVHPAHARKMLARMIEQGHKELFYYENTEGGHAGAADNEQRAYAATTVYAFLSKHLGLTLK